MDHKKLKEIENKFREFNGYMTTKEFMSAGFSYHYLSNLVKEEIVEKVKRGLYRWYSMDFGGLVHYIDVSKIVPYSVFCLYTAFEMHNLSTVLANNIYVAIDRKRGYIPSTPDYPSIKISTFSGKNFTLGIEKKKIDGHEILVYNMEKTLCDFIRLIKDVQTLKEGFSDYLQHPKMDLDKLIEYAKTLRIYRTVKNYLEISIF